MDFAHYWFGGAVKPIPFPVGNSLRFRTAATPSLTRNQKTPTNGNLVTWSAWAKHGFERPSQGGGYGGCIRGQGNYPVTSALYFYAYRDGTSTLGWSQNWGQNASGKGTTNFDTGANTGMHLRDTGWYHIVIQLGSSVGNGCMRMFINNREVTYQKNDNVCAEVYRWQTGPENIGNFGGASQTWSGYLAEVRMIDGQILAPTAFGEYNAANIWVPSQYTGTYGNNGYYLDFSSASNIGADRSGNGNNFSASGFELSNTSSTSYDWMTDSPTNNHGTWNPNKPGADNITHAAQFAKTGNKNASYFGTANGTITPPSTGKYYWEYTYVSGVGSFGLGLAFPPNEDADQIAAISGGGNVYKDGVYQGNVGGFSNGQVMGFALDMGAKQMRFYRNNSLVSTQTFTSNGPFAVKAMHVSGSGSDDVFYNTRLRYSPPSGYVALTTAGLSLTLPATITGSFVGNGSADGPFVYTGCVPGRIQYGSVNVTYGNRLSQSNVDFLCNGFKVRSGTSNSGTVSYTVTTTHSDGEYSGRQVPYGGSSVAPAPACTN